ncbi:type-1 angiotensin II receptor-associated protein-like isoform X1 [Lineus longissimus]|uniref:type-1 angiotensin II receptor-associated protein-like isoform X1 n=1 Tax=Lineus longissimus TaxID=88925 RepID=UPI002B4CA7D2
MLAPQTSLKVILVVHFVLTVWASMTEGYLPTAYIYMNLFTLAFGAYGIINQENSEAIFMLFVLQIFTILQDIIFMGIYQPRGHKHFENVADLSVTADMRNEYRFSLGMSIVNLLLKPFTSFIVYRIYQERGGSYGDFGIPGIPGLGGSSSGGPGYENIDRQSSGNNSVETAEPHQSFEKPYEQP